MSRLLRIYAPEEWGLDGYPVAWHTSTAYGGYPGGHPLANPPIKDLVRMEAGHRCERCGHPYPPGIAKEHPRGEWTPCDDGCAHGGPVQHYNGPTSNYPKTTFAQWRILTVHHLNGVKWDCRWWNLAALCQRCHLEIQGRVVMERAFIFEHSDWFKPHAAGWYAEKYLGEELTRAETEARLEELLALERLDVEEEIWPRHGARPV